jgi:hypothetical protein
MQDRQMHNTSFNVCFMIVQCKVNGIGLAHRGRYLCRPKGMHTMQLETLLSRHQIPATKAKTFIGQVLKPRGDDSWR